MTTSSGAGPETTEPPRTFDVGDTVVHPHHGAGVVVSRRPRRLGGATRNYLEIELDHHSLRIMVPCDCASRLGLRAVMDRERLRCIVEVLEEEIEVVSESWPARQKRFRSMLKSGDLLELAAVLGELATRAAKSAPPATERVSINDRDKFSPLSFSTCLKSTKRVRKSTSMSTLRENRSRS